MKLKRLRVIAGPNCSGKSTLYGELSKKSSFYDFLNADEIKANFERGDFLSLPFEVTAGEIADYIAGSSFPDAARAVMSRDSFDIDGKCVRVRPESVNSYSIAAFTDFLRSAYLANGISFSFETVFSHPSKLVFLQRAAEAGYRIYMYFVATESPELNIMRLNQRLAEGGHDVPPEKIISRYGKCLENFFPAMELAYRAYFWDNSSLRMRLIAEMNPDRRLSVYEEDIPVWFQKCILDKV